MFLHRLHVVGWSVALSVRHIPGRLNMSMLCHHQQLHTVWCIHPRVFRHLRLVFGVVKCGLLCNVSGSPVGDLCGSPIPHSVTLAVDELSFDWHSIPPFDLLSKILRRIEEHTTSLILVATKWTSQSWFSSLL